MSRRWLVLCALLLAVFLGGCLSTPPPLTRAPTQPPTVLAPSTATPIPWPEQRLVFAHLEKIWVAEGAPPYAVTLGQSPDLAPDGYRVAYLLPDIEQPGLSQVYVLDPRTGQVYLLSELPAAYGPPVWSPDGKNVAYVVETTLVVADARGELIRPLVTDVGADGEGPIIPIWAPDGQTLLCPLTRLGEPELFAVSLASGEAVRLSSTGGYQTEAPAVVLSQEAAAWVLSLQGGDGPAEIVLYTHVLDGGTLWAVRLDGTDRRRVLPQLDRVVGRIVLSPEGRRLAVLRKPLEGTGYQLWILDLSTDALYQAGNMPEMPSLLRWSEDGRTIHWLVQATLHRYTIASKQTQVVGQLPAPTPTPTPTPLPVDFYLVYYDQGEFFEVPPYGEPSFLKAIETTLAVSSGYTLREGVIAFANGADVYRHQLVGGTSRRLYTFQQEGLIQIELVWSLQGNSLLYSATYEQEEGTTLGRRVDLGVIQTDPPSLQPFTYLTDRSGATPLLYDEATGEAVFLPRGGDPAFTFLERYQVAEPDKVDRLAVEGYGTAAVSFDQHWAVATDYEAGIGQVFLRLYDLTSDSLVSYTLQLPAGTFVREPLSWSPDGRYVAYTLIRGRPDQQVGEESLGLWALWPDLIESRQIVSIESARAILVGWR
ncbi:MAG: PD40 domain-containing protein [Chloroflexia bacterium]|nr:PD40 domain-containing protein [Chloroflexia bacterium]